MLLSLLRRTFATAVCLLLLCAPAWGVGHDELSDTAEGDVVLAEARALIDAGRFMDAVNVLGPLLQETTIEASTLFLYGLAATEASQQAGVPDETREALLDEAIAAFHAMLVRRPDLVRVRLELARAFFLKGEDGLAARHFETVLAGDVPDEVKANVRHFLAEIRARRRWSFSLGFAAAPDTNIGGTSDERIIVIHGRPFKRDAEELTHSGIGLSIWGGAEYQAPVSDRLRIRAGAQAWRREYARSDFDQHFVALHLGPRWLLDEVTEASLLASGRQHWSGTAPNYRDVGGRLEVGRRMTPRVTAFARASWHDRRYRTRIHLDGPVWDTSLRGSWVVTPTVRADLTGGYAQQRPDFQRERNRSRWLDSGITAALPFGFTVDVRAQVRWTDYERGWFPFVADNGPREDLTRSYTISTHNRAITLMGFSPQLALVHETRDSNAQLHDYQRTSGELRFVQQF